MSGAPYSSRLSIAPMMDRTDRHCRYFLRLLNPDAVLYTEMVVAQAVVHGDRDRLLGFHHAEHPLVLQLGGSEPQPLADAAAEGQERGYDEINLNIGCPSDRVHSGRFGACLMAEPDTVAACVKAIRKRVALPVTVKTRIGIDEREDYGFLKTFVDAQVAAGCRHLIVHARKAILSGLSPAENRSIPPLRYEVVYRLKQDFPDLNVTLNGGVRSTAEVERHLAHVDGVMIGRQAYKEPYWLAELAAVEPPSRSRVVEQMAEYAAAEQALGTRLSHVTRHMLGLYAGQPGARHWRRFLSEATRASDAGPEVLLRSLQFVT